MAAPPGPTPPRRHDPPLKNAPQPSLCGAEIHQACEASLRRLQTSYIDLYLIHVGDLRSGGRAGDLRDTACRRRGFLGASLQLTHGES
jgi:aryl-alcohol dehydrogenase-like predicted oxidoreductase